MGDLTKDKSVLLDKLVSDCITFGLRLNEALEYVRRGSGPISKRTYFRRRTRLMSESSSNLWLSYFTRIGFVELHKKQIDTIRTVQDDSLSRLYLETQKENRDENLILRLKKDIRENSILLSEYGLGTPIIAAIKSRLEKARTKYNSDQFPSNTNEC